MIRVKKIAMRTVKRKPTPSTAKPEANSQTVRELKYRDQNESARRKRAAI